MFLSGENIPSGLQQHGTTCVSFNKRPPKQYEHGEAIARDTDIVDRTYNISHLPQSTELSSFQMTSG